ncbi:4-hydroxy-tetrahydrodipicolinate reductase 2, chloroplastic-like isoform X2 [Mangifera indica]|uniref:4-hydroxy-tetrahydrodipicolinate reductase 2, chloroplastic-like isoform X2 n=1 Tax=Mangifera indica TaxID=29780 RepID=UPI001CFA872A|nr:4-hydroxy-tetrahydrodipicolinate reductase 2, chloroplastic-like isoform X2 [Mangifera indica]
MALLFKAPCTAISYLEKTQIFKKQCFGFDNVNNSNNNVVFSRPRCLVPAVLSMSSTTKPIQELETPGSKSFNIPIMVNGCSGKMGKAVIKAADTIGLQLVPVSFGSEEESGKTLEVCDNAELYCKVGVPFVMGTTGGDRDKLYKTVENSRVYAVISPQMGKQVVAFLAAMEIMAEQFPGAFSGYSLQVLESHQTSKVDTSGTAKAVISCFQKLGVSFDMDQIQMIRDPKQQIEMVGVPEEHLAGHAFHMYHLTSPDKTVSFEFQHNVCGRSIYAEGTIDAVIFLSKKVQSQADKRIYNMIDVLREGNMR